MRRTLEQLADLPAVVAAAALAWLFGVSIGGRLAYPYDLEWMEGGMLLHARRVMQGLPLYADPAVDWIPFIYPPLYPWVVAAAAQVTGLGYVTGRLLSVIGVLAACAALVRAVRVEGGGLLLGMGAVALFVSCYDDSGTFYDLVRTDGLLVALWSWSLVSVRDNRPVRGGLLLVLAFMAKHNAAAFGLPALLWLWWAHGRRSAVRFALASVVPALLFVGAMQVSSGGNFLVYLLEVPGHHPFVADRFFPGTPQELWSALRWGLVLLGVAALALPLAARLLPDRAPPSADDAASWRIGVVYWAAQGSLAVLLAMVMRGHHGGYLNVLVPAHWALSLAIALGALALRRRWRHPVVVLLTSAVIGWQAWQGRWDVDKVTPTAADVAAGDQLIEQLSAIDGPILMPHAPWYLVRLDKEPGFHLIALWDIDHGGALAPFVDDFETAIEQGKWAAVVVPNHKFGHGLKDAYQSTDTVRYSGSAFFPKTGWRVRPRYIYTPKAAAPATPAIPSDPPSDPPSQP